MYFVGLLLIYFAQVKTYKELLFNNYTQRKITVGKYVTCMLVNIHEGGAYSNPHNLFLRIDVEFKVKVLYSFIFIYYYYYSFFFFYKYPILLKFIVIYIALSTTTKNN